MLRKETKLEWRPAQGERFKGTICRGEWPEALALLPQMLDLSSNSRERLEHGQLLVHKQAFVELVHDGEIATALELLRNHLGPLVNDPEELQSLAMYKASHTMDPWH